MSDKEKLLSEMADHLMAMNGLMLKYFSLLDDNKWLSIREAHDAYGLTPDQIRYKAKQGLIQSMKKGNTMLYSQADLQRFSPRMRGKTQQEA